MTQKEQIIQILSNNEKMTQLELSEIMYHDRRHMQNIYASLMSLVHKGVVNRIGENPAYYSLDSGVAAPNVESKVVTFVKKEKTYNPETINKLLDASTAFYDELRSDEHGRYRSWEYNYKLFYDSRKQVNIDYDYLSLNLAFYLASWGMYRGSSFLLQKDYKIHIPVIKEILKSDYDDLSGVDINNLNNNNLLDKMFKLADFISNYYYEIREQVKEEKIDQDVSDVLVTKILMGTLGCCPAYDRYFKSGLSIENVGIQRFSKNSIKELINYYLANYDIFEKVRSNMHVDELPYPPMKMIDMGFWKIGFDADTTKGLKKSH